MSILSTLLIEFWPQIAGGLGILAALLMGRRKILKNERNEVAAKKAKADAKTHGRISKVDPVDPLDRGDVVDRLRKHSQP